MRDNNITGFVGELVIEKKMRDNITWVSCEVIEPNIVARN